MSRYLPIEGHFKRKELVWKKQNYSVACHLRIWWTYFSQSHLLVRNRSVLFIQGLWKEGEDWGAFYSEEGFSLASGNFSEDPMLIVCGVWGSFEHRNFRLCLRLPITVSSPSLLTEPGSASNLLNLRTPFMRVKAEPRWGGWGWEIGFDLLRAVTYSCSRQSWCFYFIHLPDTFNVNYQWVIYSWKRKWSELSQAI